MPLTGGVDLVQWSAMMSVARHRQQTDTVRVTTKRDVDPHLVATFTRIKEDRLKALTGIHSGPGVAVTREIPEQDKLRRRPENTGFEHRRPDDRARRQFAVVRL